MMQKSPFYEKAASVIPVFFLFALRRSPCSLLIDQEFSGNALILGKGR